MSIRRESVLNTGLLKMDLETTKQRLHRSNACKKSFAYLLATKPGSLYDLDMVASGIQIMMQVFERHKIDCTITKQYLANRERSNRWEHRSASSCLSLASTYQSIYQKIKKKRSKLMAAYITYTGYAMLNFAAFFAIPSVCPLALPLPCSVPLLFGCLPCDFVVFALRVPNHRFAFSTLLC
jgi:hypothetical protein